MLTALPTVTQLPRLAGAPVVASGAVVATRGQRRRYQPVLAVLAGSPETGRYEARAAFTMCTFVRQACLPTHRRIIAKPSGLPPGPGNTPVPAAANSRG